MQIGRYASVKNQLLTVRAFGQVLEQVADARLVLYGVVEDPDYQRAVIRLVRELGLADRVVVAGPRYRRGERAVGVERVRHALALRGA